MKKIITSMILLFALSAGSQSLDWQITNGAEEFDFASSIIVDNSGNVYNTGNFGNTVDFDPSADSFTLSATAPTNVDCYIQKLTEDGEFIWAKSLAGGELVDVLDMAVDADNNLYLTGRFNGPIDFDPSGDSFILTPVGSYDAYVLKLNEDGDFEWAIAYGSTNFDQGLKIHVDSEGDVYIVGTYGGTIDLNPDPAAGFMAVTSNISVYFQKLNSDGEFITADHISTLSDGWAFLSDVHFDDDANLFVTGRFRETVDFNPAPGFDENRTSEAADDGYLLKLNSDFDYVDVYQYNCLGTSNAKSIAVDEDGNTYTTIEYNSFVDFEPGAGTTFLDPTPGGQDFAVQKLNSSGELIWLIEVRGDTEEYSYKLRLDGYGFLYISGYTNSTTVDFDSETVTGEACFVNKVDIDGNFEWVFDATYFTTQMHVANDGSLFIGGTFQGTVDFDPSDATVSVSSFSGSNDAFLQKFVPDCALDNSVTQAGALLTSNQSGATYQWFDCTAGLVPIDGATDQSYTALVNSDYAVMVTLDGCEITSDCFTVEGLSIEPNDLQFNIYPNPVSNQIFIETDANVTMVKIYDLTGKLVLSSADLQIDMSHLEVGNYILKLITDERSYSKSVVKR